MTPAGKLAPVFAVYKARSAKKTPASVSALKAHYEEVVLPKRAPFQKKAAKTLTKPVFDPKTYLGGVDLKIKLAEMKKTLKKEFWLEWKTRAGHKDVFAERGNCATNPSWWDGGWARRLYEHLEASFNQVPITGGLSKIGPGDRKTLLPCQATLGLAWSKTIGSGAPLRMMRSNCCPGACQYKAGDPVPKGSDRPELSPYGGSPLSCDGAAMEEGWKKGSEDKPLLCKWPKGFSPKSDPAIHMIRVAPCGMEKYPFCAMIKITKNATAVEGYARIVEPTGQHSIACRRVN
jgi:hypothetical protein